MRFLNMAAVAACSLIVIAPVAAGQLKFAPGTFQIYGGMQGGEQLALASPDAGQVEGSATSHKIIDFAEAMEPGSILIRTAERKLYFVLPGDKAIMYPVGVGREGFTWSGQNRITRKAIWPDWRPPKDMVAREAKRGRVLPALMAGGPANPLGARALYIGDTEFRIHGTTQPWSIGKAVSSGCIRMMNEEVIDLFNRVEIGASVTVE